MFAIYAFCRAVDDIADDGIGTRARTPRSAQRLARRSRRALCRRHAEADRLPGRGRDALRLAQGGFPRRDRRHGHGRGRGHPRRPTSPRSIFIATGSPAPWAGFRSRCSAWKTSPGFELAHHLGRALQLTNILRDLDEDAGIGRLYMPREYLDEAGIATSDPDRRAGRSAHRSRPAASVAALAPMNTIAKPHRIMRARPKGRIKTPRLMGAVYSEILREMEKVGWAPPRHRVVHRQGQADRHRAGQRAVSDEQAARSTSSARGSPGLSAAVALAGKGARVGADRRRGAGGRALPLLFRFDARPSDRQRQSPRAVRQSCDACLSARHRRRGPPGRDRACARFAFCDVKTAHAGPSRPMRARCAWWVLMKNRRVPGSFARRISGASPSCWPRRAASASTR